jgi:hypothetical protein
MAPPKDLGLEHTEGGPAGCAAVGGHAVNWLPVIVVVNPAVLIRFALLPRLIRGLSHAVDSPIRRG